MPLSLCFYFLLFSARLETLDKFPPSINQIFYIRVNIKQTITNNRVAIIWKDIKNIFLFIAFT